MADALLAHVARNLSTSADDASSRILLSRLEAGDFEAVLRHERVESLLVDATDDAASWTSTVSDRLDQTVGRDPTACADYFLVGYAALLSFLQCTVTGPPLPFEPARILFPASSASDSGRIKELRRALIDSFAVDGIAPHRLVPNIELLCLANVIFGCAKVQSSTPLAQWARLRIRFVRQRLLTEPSPTLQNETYAALDAVDYEIFGNGEKPGVDKEARVQFLLERATIETFYGLDKRAREDLDQATRDQSFQFALTGLLGKRTKFQENDISQLVVLAKSAETGGQMEASASATEPSQVALQDDTLLDNIAFTEKPTATSSTDVRESSSLPLALSELDPSNQPLLKSLDSIILLALASSITNTSPANGLTREETLPYATRVLEGGSSNWQVYTQALLVRSRIEGYKSRTVERGLLQLQALVDQVIAETSGQENTSATFLPRPKEGEAAPVMERLKYIFQLASPSRWDLEAELAQRWVQLGGLRSALEIYERLEMWAEAALCYAATEKEQAAKRIVRKQLFHSGRADKDAEEVDDEDDDWSGEERTPPPADAPRLYCILGDIDSDPAMYEKAWQVSNQRYARAQRSLGRFHLAAGNHIKAADAYAKSLRLNQLNHTSWFALGCCLLELEQFEKAIEAFSRCVQLDESDAEAWSNLAAALLKNTASSSVDDAANGKTVDPLKYRQDALKALKRAAALKHESHRIWENLLTVAASVSPPDLAAVLSAQKHIIDLRGSTVGERCVDVEMMSLVVRHVVSYSDSYDPTKPGFDRIVVDVFDKSITPLITASRPLWQLVGKLALWRNRPGSALEAQEKAWRATTTQPGWEAGEDAARWDDVVDATVELVEAYENLGPREKTEGLGGGAGALVAKDWKFKARSALRGIMGKGRECWEDSEPWTRLVDALEGLKDA